MIARERRLPEIAMNAGPRTHAEHGGHALTQTIILSVRSTVTRRLNAKTGAIGGAAMVVVVDDLQGSTVLSGSVSGVAPPNEPNSGVQQSNAPNEAICSVSQAHRTNPIPVFNNRMRRTKPIPVFNDRLRRTNRFVRPCWHSKRSQLARARRTNEANSGVQRSIAPNEANFGASQGGRTKPIPVFRDRMRRTKPIPVFRDRLRRTKPISVPARCAERTQFRPSTIDCAERSGLYGRAGVRSEANWCQPGTPNEPILRQGAIFRGRSHCWRAIVRRRTNPIGRRRPPGQLPIQSAMKRDARACGLSMGTNGGIIDSMTEKRPPSGITSITETRRNDG